MKSYFRRLIWICAILTLVLPSQAAWADSIDVSFDYWGTPGDYVLDFKVSNNLTSIPMTDVFFFGVQVDQGSINSPSDIPSGYENSFSTWNNYVSGNGGSNNTYNNNWDAVGSRNHLTTNHSLSGFIVHLTSAVAPTAPVNWFAFTTDVSGSPPDSLPNSIPGLFYRSAADPPGTPGFSTLAMEGTVSGNPVVIPVPEPTTLALLSLGGIAFAFRAYRRRQTNCI